MHTTIIYAHPWDGSFNHSILTTIQGELDRQQTDYEVIDLHQDKFNPVYSAEELAHFAKGIALDPLVTKYQDILAKTDKLIFIFPIWWNDVPALIKGFIDKVMLKGYAYEDDTSNGVQGKLTHIQSALVLTTSGAPTAFIETMAGNGIQNIFVNVTLKQLGIQAAHWHNFGEIDSATHEQIEQDLEEAKALI